MARKKTETDNSEVKAVLVEYLNFKDLMYWQQDIIRGAIGQKGSGDRGVSAGSILSLLQSVETISTDTIGTILNRMRQGIEGKDYSVRMIEIYTRIARTASQGLRNAFLSGQYRIIQKEHVERFNFEDDLQGYYANHPGSQRYLQKKVYFDGMDRDFTEEEREQVRRLAIFGSSQEIKDYITAINAT